MDIKYSIQFHSLWHSGSGESRGADLDSTVLRDNGGFPFIPGKTIKGIIKDAMLDSKGIDQPDEDIIQLFGKEAGRDNENPHGFTGKCHFTDAHMSVGLKSKIGENELMENLFEKVASISINNDGTARDHSLRTMEVAVPMTLYGEILDVPDNAGMLFNDAVKMVKRLGVGRNRGYGCCTLKIEKGYLV